MEFYDFKAPQLDVDTSILICINLPLYTEIYAPQKKPHPYKNNENTGLKLGNVLYMEGKEIYIMKNLENHQTGTRRY